MPTRRGTSLRRWGDAAMPALLVLFLVLATRHIGSAGRLSAGERPVDAVAYACVAVTGAALVLRRRLPLTVVALVTVALLVYLVRGYPGGPIYLTWYVALFSLAMARQRAVGLAAAVASSVALYVAGFVADTGPQRLVHLIFIGWSAAAVLLGDAVRSRRERVLAIEERARQLEQSREDDARRRVAEERLRIARDLHDSVAHTMATINVHAGAAAHVIDRRPGEARDSLRVIERASREVIEELTAMLRLLRFDAGDADRVPTPGIGRLAALVESVRAAGVDVRLDVDYRQPAPPPVDVAAYRIVQESLTNVIRHAGRPVTVRVAVHGSGDGGLAVEVVDDGGSGDGGSGDIRGGDVRSAADGAGVGITGMRERVEATGGRLDAGPRPDGRGFAVRATWPARTRG